MHLVQHDIGFVGLLLTYPFGKATYRKALQMPWMKRRILKLKLRLPCFNAELEHASEEFVDDASILEVEQDTLHVDQEKQINLGSNSREKLEYYK